MDNSLVPVRHEPLTYHPGYPDSSDNAGVHTNVLLEYWRILRRRKRVLIIATFLGVLVAALFTIPQTPVYQARATLEIQDFNQEFMNMKQINPVAEDSGSSALNEIQTQIKILQSDALSDRTQAKLRTTSHNSALISQSRLAVWRRALNLQEPPSAGAYEAELKAVAKSLKVRAAGQTRIIELLADSTDPKLAAMFANTLTS